jgi:hypothetical protein
VPAEVQSERPSNTNLLVTPIPNSTSGLVTIVTQGISILIYDLVLVLLFQLSLSLGHLA